MVESLRLYAHYVALSIRSQLEYRASTLMLAVGQLLTTGLEFFSIWALFERFGQIQGWSLAEVALLYGMANTSFALAEAIGRGFVVFDEQVRSGEFDRVLLRPRGSAFQVLASHLQITRVGRLTQGIFVLGYAVWQLGIDWSSADVALLLTAIAGGACTFIGVFVLQATLAFWTVEGLEIVNTISYGGVEAAQYPLSIYGEGLRRFLTYVIPLAFLNYVPATALLDRPLGFGPGWLPWVAPLIGVAFLGTMLQFWKLGVRHYRSTGS